MPLTLVEPSYPYPEIDIIAVPAVGADPKWTWKGPQKLAFPAEQDFRFRTIYDSVSQARVFLYSYPDPREGDAIINYATELLGCVAALSSPKLRPLHFAGYNTGGLVIKRALVLARSSANELWNQVASSCFTVAFFGVPHYGSDVLSDETYLQSIREILGTPTPDERLGMEATNGRDGNFNDTQRLQADRQAKVQKWKNMEEQLRNLLSADNRENNMRLSRDFASLALGMRKIWTFVEAIETPLRVLSGGNREAEELETVDLSVVDRRSATLNNFEVYVGNEEVVAIYCEHSSLSRFGDGEDFDSENLDEYIKQLQYIISNLPPDGTQDLTWIEEKVQTEVQLFYEASNDGAGSSIKLWSAKPSLQDLLRKGPSQCLNERFKEDRSAEVFNERTSRRNRSPNRTGFPQRPRAASIAAIEDITDTNIEKPLLKTDLSAPFELRNRRVVKHPPDPSDEGDVSAFQWVTGRRVKSDIEAQHQSSRSQRNTKALNHVGVSVVDWAVQSYTQTPSTPPLDSKDNAHPSLSASVQKKRPNLPAIVVQPPAPEEDDTRERNSIEIRPDITHDSTSKQAENRKEGSVQKNRPNLPAIVVQPPAPEEDDTQERNGIKIRPDIIHDSTSKQAENRKEGSVQKNRPNLPTIVVQPPAPEEDDTQERNSIEIRPDITHDSTSKQAENRKEGNIKLATGPADWLRHTGGPEQTVPAKRKNFQVPSVTSRRFRWTHIPCNNMLFVQKIFETIAEEKKKPRMFEDLLRPQAWALKRHVARHDSPHACYMEPHFEALSMNKSLAPYSALPHDLQMVVYLPYLHWDNFGALRDRNALIQRRLKQKSLHPFDEEIAKAGLPIHHRRSLDQYRYPTLRSTAARDDDQVLHKRTRLQEHDPKTKTDKAPYTVKGPYLAEKSSNASSHLLASTGRQSDAAKQSRRTHRPSPVRDEDRSTVLMVDQLWCWVADPDTIITCFTPKEERDGDPPSQPADLRRAIYDDVNGDSQFATKCDNPYDFLALVVCDAITVFLDNMQEKKLQVFRIFEDYISQLTEEQTESFKKFRDNHRDETLGRLDGYPQLHRPVDDSGTDLANYLELRDIEDELTTLLKLFNEQTTVVQSMIDQWKGIMAQLRRKLASKELLVETINKIASYRAETEMMIMDCRTAQDAYKTLLDMKQKQANVDEMSLARHSTMVATDQGRAIMFFTIFTIVFLPLSFFTSFFGMNVREWSGQPTNLPLHTVGVLMGSISAALILIALVLAFNKPIYQVVSYALQHGISLPFSNPISRLRRWQEEQEFGSRYLASRNETELPQDTLTNGDLIPALRKRNTD
ncbi:MAG: hypothetical protein M1821_005851 [Bathelium mastoideum]|nr:MAG: hypothetical protein M1821_005851 [Bathelium mastoideum]